MHPDISFWAWWVSFGKCLSCYAPNRREFKIRVNVLNRSGNNVRNMMCTFKSLPFAQTLDLCVSCRSHNGQLALT